jgi:hypothetical protein
MRSPTGVRPGSEQGRSEAVEGGSVRGSMLGGLLRSLIAVMSAEEKVPRP